MTIAVGVAARAPWLMAERSQAPTPRRRQRAREEGQGWFSPDFQAALALLVAVLILRWYLPWSGRQLANMEAAILGMVPGPHFSTTWYTAAGTAAHSLLNVLLPITLPILGVGLVASFGQTGLKFNLSRLTPDFTRLDPFAGLQRMFSVQGVWMLVKGLLKMAIIGVAVGLVISSQLRAYAQLIVMPMGQALTESGKLLIAVLERAAAAFFLMGIVDAVYQFRSFQGSLKMSQQEVRDEMKDSEGDPRLRGRRREMHRRLIQTGMREVKNASVVITNPTHYAVALKWDEQAMPAPVVAAKGTDEVALAMREIAYENSIPIVENPPLARALYLVPLGEVIKEEHYQAVADILAFIIRRKRGGPRV